MTGLLGSLPHSQEPWKIETEKVKQNIELNDVNRETRTHYFQSKEITLPKQISVSLHTELKIPVLTVCTFKTSNTRVRVKS